MLQSQRPVVGYFDEPIDAFNLVPQFEAVTEFEQEDDDQYGLSLDDTDHR